MLLDTRIDRLKQQLYFPAVQGYKYAVLSLHLNFVCQPRLGHPAGTIASACISLQRQSLHAHDLASLVLVSAMGTLSMVQDFNVLIS